MRNTRKILALVQMFLVISLTFSLAFAFNSPKAYAQEEEQVCCEQDNSGNYCSYVPAGECTSAGVLKASTSCDQTSFCSAGCCSGISGFCYSGYPKALCESQEGSYTSGSCSTVNECQLGCCVIGTQADFVTKDRCIEETSIFPDLEVDFREDVLNEQDCLNLARNQEKGCCVSTDGSCIFGAKSECTEETVVNGTGFYKDTFCSGLTNLCECAPHNPNDFRATTCLPDDDNVYWEDSCGNPEGVVESGLSSYGGAADSGNCDYNSGTLCGDSDGDGIHVCESLDCEAGTRRSQTENNKLSLNLEGYDEHGTPESELGKDGILNGESWCLFDSEQQQQIFNELSTADRQGKDPVGSRYYRSICINGQELVEPCKDFREEYCYYNTIDVDFVNKKYTESRCIENEWQPCTNECNTANPSTMGGDEYKEALKKDQKCCLSSNRDCSWNGNRCVPAVSPGFRFWEGEGNDVCSQANSECPATFVCGGWNRLFGCNREALAGTVLGGGAGIGAGAYTAATLGASVLSWPVGVASIGGGLLVGLSSGLKGGWQIVSGGECLSQDYLQSANNLCRSYGDCGADYNFLADDQTIEDKFKLSFTGFTNTENINSELADYARENTGDLDDKKSSEGRGDVEFDFTDGVPGNLSDAPDWERGKDFFDFTTPEGGTGNKFKRALFTEDDLTGTGLFSPLGLAGLSLLGGIVGGLTKTVPFLTGVGIGLSASPLGFLVLGITKFAGVEALKDVGLSAARDAAAEQAADKVVSQHFAQGALNKAERDALRSTLAQNELTKDVAQDVTNDQLYQIARGEAVNQPGGLQMDAAKSQSLRDEAVDNVVKKSGTKIGQRQSVNSFAGVMTGVSAALWAYTIFQLGDVLGEDVKTASVSTTCQPWQAPVYRTSPTDEDPCQKCNPDFKDYVDEDGTPKDFRALKACSEYRCKSLGASCELLNQGTTEETCVSINKLDTNSPKIDPWPEGFTLGITESDIEETETGFKITKEIPIYATFNIALQTDEPAQCKMSLEHSQRYDAMGNNFFGSNTFKYFHVNNMVYPSSIGANESQGITLSGGGHYELYLRCTDAVGNANEADYVIELDVAKEPDLTAPDIVGSSLSPPNVLVGEQNVLGSEVFLTNGAEFTDITLFVDEPAECRYDYNPLEFNVMNITNSCKTAINLPDAPPYFACKYIRDVGGLAGIGPAPSGFVSKAGLVKYVYFKCRDHPEPGYTEERNFNKEAYTVTLRGSDSLNITNLGPEGTIKTSTSLVNVTLQVQTRGGAELDGSAICKYTTEEANEGNIVAMTEFLNTGSSVHTQPWQPSSGDQKFFIGCHDKAGNLAYGEIGFTVERDVTPPFITKVYRDESFQPPQFTIELNEAAECKDSVEGTFEYETEGNLMNVVDTTRKIFSSTIPTSNVYYIICRDDFGNQMPPATIQIAEV